MTQLQFTRRFSAWAFGPMDAFAFANNLEDLIRPGGFDLMGGEIKCEDRVTPYYSGISVHQLPFSALETEQLVNAVTAHWRSSRPEQSVILNVDWINLTVTLTTGNLANAEMLAAVRSLFNQRIPPVSRAHLETLGSVATQLAEVKSTIDSHLQAAETFNTQAQELWKKAQDAVAVETLTSHADVFTKDAEKYETASWLWLMVSLLSLLAISAVSLWMWFDPSTTWENTTPAPGLVNILGRIAFLSILVTVLGVAVRQYSAASHNAVVNKHRANALRSYEAFAEITRDAEARTAMLAHAIGLVFSVQDTGYSRSPMSNDNTSVFAEVIKNISRN